MNHNPEKSLLIAKFHILPWPTYTPASFPILGVGRTDIQTKKPEQDLYLIPAFLLITFSALLLFFSRFFCFLNAAFEQVVELGGVEIFVFALFEVFEDFIQARKQSFGFE